MIIRVLLADDHSLLRNGLKRLFSETADIVVVAEAVDGPDALEKMRHGGWDVALLDVNMPGMNGLEVLRRIMANNASHRVLMLSMYPEDEYAIRAMRAGASAYLTKDSPTDLLMTVIRRLANGGKYVSPALAEQLLFKPESSAGVALHSTLSDRELHVLKLIVTGVSLTAIAEELSLSVKTVSTYRSRIMEKMNMQNNAQLIRYATEHELTE
ncbi:MAG: response regulator transcription factor [Nitrosospira sp.]|nr:response regulator transcription factor [Nitrosospira sp.]